MTTCWPELLCREVCCLLGAQVRHATERLLRLVWGWTATTHSSSAYKRRCHGRAWMHQEWLHGSGSEGWGHDQHLVQLVVLSRIWFLQPWDLLLGMRTDVERGDPPHKKTQLCQQVDPSGKESFILGMSGDGGYKQGIQGDWYKTPQQWYNKAKGVSLKCMYANTQTLGTELEELEPQLQSWSL